MTSTLEHAWNFAPESLTAASESPQVTQPTPRTHHTLTAILCIALSCWMPGQPLHASAAEEASIAAVTFTDIGAGLIGVAFSWVEWGDYDNDGDLDFVLMGSRGYPNFYTRIYRNDAGAVTDIVAGLPGVRFGAARWGDYDNDGDLDLLLTGNQPGVAGRISRIYRNDGGVFTDIVAGLPGLNTSAADWGDYDNDGDLDLILAGEAGEFNSGARVYRNDSGSFVNIHGGVQKLSGLTDGSAEWGDYDRDGDLDILLVGTFSSFGSATALFRNDAGAFTAVTTGLPGAVSGTWGDYDNDGDPDILLTGTDLGGLLGPTRIYRNDAGTFTSISSTLQNLKGRSTWGDYDNDGDLDVLTTGAYNFDPVTMIYRNDAGTFVDISATLVQLFNSCAAWGDYDGDGDLDFLLAGSHPTGHNSIVYRNDSFLANIPPSPPTRIDAVRVGAQVIFSWYATSDPHTPQAGLQYNLRVGSTPESGDIVSPMSSSPDGYRRVVRRGNCGYLTTRAVTIPPGTDYYWGVQAIDTAFEASTFAFEDTNVQSFTDIGAGLQGLSGASVDWGDYDNDGDLDIFMMGHPGSGGFSRIYRNDAGVFTDSGAGLLDVSNGDGDWGDYDNDGDLDLLVMGHDGAQGATRLYRNDAGVFTDTATALPNVFRGSTAWGDYDADGDLDILLIGLEVSSWFSRVYRNDAGVFSDIGAGLVGLLDGAADWGDYDGDGDLDIVLCGIDGFTVKSRVYRNDGGTFTDIGAALLDMTDASVDWGDYDDDGDLDILMAGKSGSVAITRIYINTGGTFTDSGQALWGVSQGSAQWGDYDNDGDLDILSAGLNLYGDEMTLVYRNDAGMFVRFTSGLPALKSASAAWGDYDNDGDLDILLTGQIGATLQSGIHRNNSTTANTPPGPPTNLQAQLIGADVIRFSWTAPPDGQTPSVGLNYNLRVGTSPGASDLYCSMANLSSGWRRIAQRGYIQGTSLDFSFQGIGPIYWSVQAVDHGLAGSLFSSNSGAVTAIDDDQTPKRFALGHNVPNPFNPYTTISFELPKRMACEMVVYDLSGRQIRTLFSGVKDAGTHELSWNGRDERGRGVASGTYVYRLSADGIEESRLMTLLK